MDVIDIMDVYGCNIPPSLFLGSYVPLFQTMFSDSISCMQALVMRTKTGLMETHRSVINPLFSFLQ